MSGGIFNYRDMDLYNEIYTKSEMCDDYNLESDEVKKSSKLARRNGPFEDLVINELVHDVLCLIHSYDWYTCGDNCKETYDKDKKFFKDKWIKKLKKEYVKDLIDDEIESAKKSLYDSLDVKE